MRMQSVNMTTQLMSTFFLRDLPDKMSSKYQLYASWLNHQLQERKEMILDFKGLQLSVDPSLDPLLLEGEKFDYEEYLQSYFHSTAVFPALEIFKLRGWEMAAPEFPLVEGIKQLHVLTELDLAGNNLSGELEENLQLWSLVELRVLKLDKTHLSKLPPSVGRLRKLEQLLLSDNSLSNLPLTLGFCQSLKLLDLAKNKFVTLPYVIRDLKNLQDLKRWDNPLHKRFNGYEQFPHIVSQTLPPEAKKTPDSLQALTCRAIMATHINYWVEENLPPLQCKMLDTYATQYKYCENCHQANSGKVYAMRVMLLKFAGLNDVPFSFFSCESCQNVIIDKLTSQQTEIHQQMEKEYAKNMIEAEKALERGEVNDLSSNVPPEQITPFVSHYPPWNQQRRQRIKKCTIM